MSASRRALIKVVILGSANIGKSALMRAIVGLPFISTYKPTIGTDFITKALDQCTIQCWDTAGQKRFRVPGYSYIRGTDIYLCAFDLTNKESLNESIVLLKDVLSSLDTFCGKYCVKLVGLKTDLVDKRAVSDADIRKKIKELKDSFPNQVISDKFHIIGITPTENIGIAELTNAIPQVYQLLTTAGTIIHDEDETQASTTKTFIYPELNAAFDKFQDEIERLREKSSRSRHVMNRLTKLTDCSNAVTAAKNAIAKSPREKHAALKKLHDVANSIANVKRLKALSICMIAIGAILACIGLAITLVSMGAIATGILAPLGVPGIGGGASIMAGGGVLIASGLTLFATRRRLCTPANSMGKIETLIKHTKIGG